MQVTGTSTAVRNTSEYPSGASVSVRIHALGQIVGQEVICAACLPDMGQKLRGAGQQRLLPANGAAQIRQEQVSLVQGPGITPQ